MKRILAVMLLCATFIFSLSTAYAREMRHPGASIGQEQLDRIKTHVLADDEPWSTAWKQMQQDSRSKSTYKAKTWTHIGGKDGSRQRAINDAMAAYLNMLEYYVLKDSDPATAEAHAKCAVDILNAWAQAIDMEEPEGELFMLPIGGMVPAAELCHSLYEGWATEDVQKFKDVCLNKWYPDLRDYQGSNLWPGWDGPTNTAIMAIGIFCDRPDIYEAAVDYYKNGMPADHPNVKKGGRYGVGCGAGRLGYMVFDPANGLTVEMGRDMPHAEIGPHAAAELCEMAWNQGDDLFVLEDYALLKAFEGLYRYNLTGEVNWTPFNDYDNHNFFDVTTVTVGRITGFTGTEIAYRHFVDRLGLDMPYTEAAIRLRGITSQQWESPNYTVLNQATETNAHIYTDKLEKPETPVEVEAIGGAGRVTLRWKNPDWRLVNGTTIERSNSASSGFQEIYTYTMNTSTAWVDTTVREKRNYYYRIRTRNPYGVSSWSAVVRAKANSTDVLPDSWQVVTTGNAQATAVYSTADDHAFLFTGTGGNWGTEADEASFLALPIDGDGVFTACILTDALHKVGSGGKERTGICLRENMAEGARMVGIGVGDTESRYTYAMTRSTRNSKATWYAGNTHTSSPVWYRITRTGSSFTIEQGIDGETWHEVTTQRMTLPKKAYACIYIATASEPIKVYVPVVEWSGNTQDGIESVQVEGTKNELWANAMYDISGRCMEKYQRGMCIINGKKVIIR